MMKEQQIFYEEGISQKKSKTLSSFSISSNYQNLFLNGFCGVESIELKQGVEARHFDDSFCLSVLDGRYLAVGSSDATISIYDLEKDCQLLRKINYYSEPILVLEQFKLCKNSLLLSSGYDQIINVWNYQNGKKILCLEACGSELTKLQDNLDLNHIVGSTNDGRIVVWSFVQQKIVQIIKLESHQSCDHLKADENDIDEEMHSDMELESYGCIYSFIVMKKNHYLILQRGTISEVIFIPEPLPKLQKIREFPSNPDAVQFNIVPFESSYIVAVGTSRGYVNLFDYDTGERQACSKTLRGAVNEILTIQNSNKNKQDCPTIIITSHEDNQIKIENLKTGESFKFENENIFCYNECMNYKMQFFSVKDQIYLVVISQRHLQPYFSILAVHTKKDLS